VPEVQGTPHDRWLEGAWQSHPGDAQRTITPRQSDPVDSGGDCA